MIAELSQSNPESFVAEDDTPVVGFPRFPCHTQSVERFVKLVTESCAAVCGTKSRDGFILCGLKSRELMPSYLLIPKQNFDPSSCIYYYFLVSNVYNDAC